MDPTANLEEQLQLANMWLDADDGDELDGADATRMGELVLSLHEWIIKGGFLPKSWAEAQKKA